MNSQRLDFLKSKKEWDSISNEFTVKDICHLLNFESSMVLVYEMFVQNLDNDDILDFVIRLLLEIKKDYPEEWSSDWKNDVFLGKIFSYIWRYQEAYDQYKIAFEKLRDPPDSLLLLLAGCKNTPSPPPITNEESEKYLLKAIRKKITYEAALMMRELARDKKNTKDEMYWNSMGSKLEKENIHTETILPNVLLAQNKS